jgi:hypothetical protein
MFAEAHPRVAAGVESERAAVAARAIPEISAKLLS